MKRYVTIDIFKFILSILIIFIHFPLKSDFNKYLDALARIGVPYFFMVSGYFFTNPSFKKIVKKTMSFIFIAIVTSLVCMMIKVYWWQNLNDVIFWIRERMTMNEFIKFIFFNELFFERHLWFMFALIYCYIISYILNKSNILKKSYVIIPVLLVINIFINYMLPYMGIDVEIYWTRNFLFTGLPFFLLGNFMNGKKIKITKKYLICLILLGIVLTFAEVIFFGKKDLYMGSILSCISLFLLSISKKEDIKRDLFIIIGIASSIIYYIHIPLGDAISAYNTYHFIIPDTIYQLYSPIIIAMFSIITSLLLATLLYMLKKNKRNRKEFISI